METFSALLALCEGNPLVTATVDSPHKGQWLGALMYSLICACKQLSKQSRLRWFETPSRSLWRHSNENHAMKSELAHELYTENIWHVNIKDSVNGWRVITIKVTDMRYCNGLTCVFLADKMRGFFLGVVYPIRSVCLHTIFVEYDYPISAVCVDQVGGGDAIVRIVPDESGTTQPSSQPSVAIDFGRLVGEKKIIR